MSTGVPVELSSQTLALPSSPVGLDAQMREALGSLYADRFERCHLYILAQRPSEKPGILDEEFSRVEDRCSCVVLALLLQGSMKLEQPGFRIGGSHYEGVVQVRKTSSLRAFYWFQGTPWLTVDAAVLHEADLAAAGIQTLNDNPDSFDRFRRGLRALKRALEARHAEDRLHQSVRAVEALIVPEQGRTKSQFKSRVGALAGVSHPTLGDLYDLRSAAEHMNDLKAAAPHLFEPTEAQALRRVHQAHELARWLYRCILSQPQVLELFKTDESIRAFQGFSGERKE